MAHPTKEDIKRELDRLNPLIEDLMEQIREKKAFISDAKRDGNKAAMKSHADDLDKLEAQKNKYKDDRYAVWATEKTLNDAEGQSETD